MSDLARLREPFPPEQIGKIPNVWCKDCRDSRPAACGKHKIERCDECNQRGTTAHNHLDYVGHAEVTHRLLDVDPGWYWEPVAFDAEGLPAVKRDGKQVSLWIKLTVGGVTRYGVGIVDAGKAELDKQLISDAIRNAAMRFGVALDLWAKSELDHTSAGEGAPQGAAESVPSPVTLSDDESGPTPEPPSSSEPSPASDAETSAPSAPGRSPSGGGSGVRGSAPTAAASDDKDPEIRRLIDRFNNLHVTVKSEALALKKKLEIRNWYEADPDAIAKMRAKVAELEAVPA